MIACIEIVNNDGSKTTHIITDYIDNHNQLSRELREYKKLGLIKAFRLFAYEPSDFVKGEFPL